MVSSTTSKKIFLLGATGTIGRATAQALLARGHDVTCLIRESADRTGLPNGLKLRIGDVGDATSLARDGFRGEAFDALISCLASRTGVPSDAWAIDHKAHLDALTAAKQAGVEHMVLLSAICVQKPRLGFQHAKLAFEAALRSSGLRYSIVRPTAYFKSLSGQVERVRQGKPFLVFGDGKLTACKPISDHDLGTYLAECLDDETRWNKVLPIGGPGPAITPREQGEYLFRLLGRKPRFRQVPPGLLKGISGGLGLLGKFSLAMARKSELARIGHYYATESMLVWDQDAGRYDPDATPSAGTETLFDYYAKLVRGEATAERGDHAVF